jgi:hypothetical protein
MALYTIGTSPGSKEVAEFTAKGVNGVYDHSVKCPECVSASCV